MPTYSYIAHSHGYYVGYSRPDSSDFIVLCDCTTMEQAESEITRLERYAKRLAEWVYNDQLYRGVIDVNSD
jgi:hypothetical protein